MVVRESIIPFYHSFFPTTRAIEQLCMWVSLKHSWHSVYVQFLSLSKTSTASTLWNSNSTSSTVCRCCCRTGQDARGSLPVATCKWKNDAPYFKEFLRRNEDDIWIHLTIKHLYYQFSDIKTEDYKLCHSDFGFFSHYQIKYFFQAETTLLNGSSSLLSLNQVLFIVQFM